MSRTLRIEFSGAVYHVTSRGDRREIICRDDEGRISQLEIIAHVMDRFDAQVLAYCWRGNHFHQLIHIRQAIFIAVNAARQWRLHKGVQSAPWSGWLPFQGPLSRFRSNNRSLAVCMTLYLTVMDSVVRHQFILQKAVSLKAAHAQEDLETRAKQAKSRGKVNAARFTPHRIPVQRNRVIRTPAGLARQFTSDLSALIKEAFEADPSGVDIESLQQEPQAENPTATDLACRAACACCRGACCSTGLTNRAWSTVETIQRHRALHPD